MPHLNNKQNKNTNPIISRQDYHLTRLAHRGKNKQTNKQKNSAQISPYVKFTQTTGPTFSSVQFSRSVVSDSLRTHESQHTRPPCPSPTPGVYSNSCPSSQRCHPAISSSVVPFSSCRQSLPASGSFPMSQLFTWGGQSIGVSASGSVLPMNTQDWSPLGWTGLGGQKPKGRKNSTFFKERIQLSLKVGKTRPQTQ